jgi:hypothetical protein
MKTLTWNDFSGTPDPQKPNLQAFTSASFNLPTVTPTLVPGTTNYHFEDNVAITIAMNLQKSWKRTPPNDLLKHEQCHYDIVALIARDLFIDIMQLKANTYPNGPAALADLRPILTKYGGKVEKINVIYDSLQQTNHGNNPPSQAKWNAMIQRAFTEPRNPLESAPDGTPYKIPLLDVLSQNGINP